MTQPDEPTTAAGRALDEIPTHHFRSHELRVSSCDYALTPNGQCTCGLTQRIIAIEREAVSAYLSDPATVAALAAALEGPWRIIKSAPCAHGDPCRESMCVDYGRRDLKAAAILAALRAAREGNQ